MTTAETFCPLCGLSGCAARIEGAERVGAAVLFQLRRALAVTALPDPAGPAALVTQALSLLLLPGDTPALPDLLSEPGLDVNTHARAG